jgi:hypothetical protein
VLNRAATKAIGGGKAGAAAGVAQVLSLMWLRTAMNYQYRFGGSLPDALRDLWLQGGVGRLYQGLPLALLQNPLSRFGDVASNSLVLALLADVDFLDPATKTVLCSATAGLWRVALLPLDAAKTALQVQGWEGGAAQLKAKVTGRGPLALYDGAAAASAATFAGHYPWFATYNFLSARFPPPALADSSSGDAFLPGLLYSASLGLCSSLVSDTCSNSLRVIKTTMQTAETAPMSSISGRSRKMTYPEAVAKVVAEGGVSGLLGRGLATRFLCNGLQGMLFSVTWKYFEKVFCLL